MEQKQASDWNRRQVDFSKLFGSDKAAFAALLNSLDVQSGMTIGDIMSGYGDVSSHILEHCAQRGLLTRMILLDAYEAQLQKSREHLASYEMRGFPIQRIHADARFFNLESKLDIAIIKLGLHEVRKSEQQAVLKNVYDSLKSRGNFYVWAGTSQTPELTETLRRVARKKDEIAGYSEFVENRYFPALDEIISGLNNAGFRNIEIVYVGEFQYSTQNYLQADFKGDKAKQHEMNEFIRGYLSPKQKQALKFQDTGDSVTLSFTKAILKSEK